MLGISTMFLGEIFTERFALAHVLPRSVPCLGRAAPGSFSPVAAPFLTRHRFP